MQAIRKFASNTISRNTIPAVAPLTAARFNTTFSSKERADEARYFAQADADRVADMKANLDKIMSNPDHEKRDEVLKALASETTIQEPNFIEKWKLNDPRFAPLASLFVLAPVLANEWIQVTYSWPIVGLIFGSYTFAFLKARRSVFDSLRKDRETRIELFKNFDDAKPAGHKDIMGSYNNILSLKTDLEAKNQLVDDLQATRAQALTAQQEHVFRDALVQKLDSLSALEDAASNAIRNRMLTSIKADVLKTLTTNNAVKEQALAQAIAVLTSGGAKPIGKDVVGETFGASIKAYREDYVKKPQGSDEILIQLEKDVANVICPPTIDTVGTNVYESHPI